VVPSGLRREGKLAAGYGLKPDNLPLLIRRIYRLLQKTQPIAGEYDVAWRGPYYIPRPGEWHATHFVLYNGTLYGSILDYDGLSGLSWHLATGAVKFERGLGTGGYDDEWEWPRVLQQIERRLQSALRNFSRYNALVARRLPLACRHGAIQRRLTWPKQVEAAIPRAEIARARRTLSEAAGRPLLPEMTRARYLEAAGIAYDACWKELRPLSPLEKYRRKADGRHGGLLDLPEDDGEAFAKWFRSDAWAGTHPWEIVFGHPHGIMLSPRFHEDLNRWSYWLWVDSEGWYAHAARMAIALGKRNIPFEFQDGPAVLDALEGLDEVEVGPAFDQVQYGELRRERPDAVESIRWDPVPGLQPITPDQRERVLRAERETR
jgi:hypothetical protein